MSDLISTLFLTMRSGVGLTKHDIELAGAKFEDLEAYASGQGYKVSLKDYSDDPFGADPDTPKAQFLDLQEQPQSGWVQL